MKLDAKILDLFFDELKVAISGQRLAVFDSHPSLDVFGAKVVLLQCALSFQGLFFIIEVHRRFFRLVAFTFRASPSFFLTVNFELQEIEHVLRIFELGLVSSLPDDFKQDFDLFMAWQWLHDCFSSQALIVKPLCI